MFDPMVYPPKRLENTPTLETPRLILRRAEEHDLDALHTLLSDEEVNTFLPWFPMKTLADTRAFVQREFFDYYALPWAYRYVICPRETDTPIGYIKLGNEISRDFGYALRKEYWHQGIMSEAGDAMVDRLREAGMPYITATHDVNNPNSGRVMKHVGMTYRYSYEELLSIKKQLVVFRMYQLNLDGQERTYLDYQRWFPKHFVEEGV